MKKIIISEKQVEYLARLANLFLKKKEVKVISEQLSKTLQYVEKLKKIDTSDIEPTSHICNLVNVTREDKVAKSLDQDEIIKDAKDSFNGYFLIRKIINRD